MTSNAGLLPLPWGRPQPLEGHAFVIKIALLSAVAPKDNKD
jgi:hypothetical protein